MDKITMAAKILMPDLVQNPTHTESLKQKNRMFNWTKKAKNAKEGAHNCTSPCYQPTTIIHSSTAAKCGISKVNRVLLVRLPTKATFTAFAIHYPGYEYFDMAITCFTLFYAPREAKFHQLLINFSRTQTTIENQSIKVAIVVNCQNNAH